MAQAWSLIGLLATAFGALIVVTHRSMSVGLSGLRNEMIARFEKVDQRFEMVDQRFEHVHQRFDQVEARLAKVEQTAETLDHDVRTLNRAVLGNQPPANN